MDTIKGLQLPLFDIESTWRPPAKILNTASTIAVDLETRDPLLKRRGPGFLYGQGEPIGVAIATNEGKMYLPFNHQGGDNLDLSLVKMITRDFMSKADEIVMANATYDLGWLLEWGVPMPRGIVRDIQVAEALIDEEQRSYSLNTLSLKYLNIEKNESMLRQAAETYRINPKSEMWKLPARYVGAYAEDDAAQTLLCYEKQKPQLSELGLWKVWDLECDITKICSKMTRKGIRVDLDAASQLNEKLKKEETEIKNRLRFNVNSANEVATFLEKTFQERVPKTLKGNYSITDQYLNELGYKEAKEIVHLRQLTRLRKTFIEEGVLEKSYKGRIHAEFKQTTSEDGGTRSGRFSSKNPNMQQVPARSEIGQIIRKLYIAEDDALWAKCDYSSQEPRLQVHYGIVLGLKGAKDAKRAFDKGVKIYTFLEDNTGLPYATCKMLVLGIGYGMGVNSMAEKLNISVNECERIRQTFQQKVPYIQQLFDRCRAKAQKDGFIRTVLGRRSNFPWWESGNERVKGYENAKKKLGRSISRAFTNNALNRLIQGSAADQAKLAMKLCDEQGFDIRLPVHDEINAIVQNPKQATEIKEIMEQAIKFELDFVADLDLGTSWK